MGSIGDCHNNLMMESFFGTMQLDCWTGTWTTQQELANAQPWQPVPD
jgi:putative transposase